MVSEGSSDVLISVRHVGKRFGGRTPTTALSDVSLDVRRGEFITIVGPSGCGKTTLLRIIAGLIAPTAGAIVWATSGPHNTGLVFQTPNLLPWRTAAENVALPLELDDESEEATSARVAEVLTSVGMLDEAEFYPRDLSGGMKSRVAIARALAQNPDVLLMDEPFADLDIATRRALVEELRSVWLSTSKTVIYVTHDVSEATYLAQRVVVLSGSPGTIRAIHTIEDASNSAAHRPPWEAEDGKRGIAAQIAVELESDSQSLEGQKAARPTHAQVPPHSTQLKWPPARLFLIRLSVFALCILLWKAITWAFGIPSYLLPPPEQVISAYFASAATTLWLHTGVTLLEIVAGFALGVGFGFAIGYSLGRARRVEQILSPYIVAAQIAPKVAFAPLIAIWFGFGASSKIVLVGLICFFPIVVNVMLGLKAITEEKRDLMTSLRASRSQAFLKLELPSMLPELFAGLRTAMTLAIVGAVVGEYVAARAGLGYLAKYGAGMLDMGTLFAAIAQLILLGIVLYWAIGVVERRIVRWDSRT